MSLTSNIGFFFSRKDNFYSFLEKAADFERDFDDVMSPLNYITRKRITLARDLLGSKLFDRADQIVEPIRLHLLVENTECIFVLSKNLNEQFSDDEHFPMICFFLDIESDLIIFNQDHQKYNVFESIVKLVLPIYADVRGRIGLSIDTNESIERNTSFPWETYGTNTFFPNFTNIETLIYNSPVPFSKITKISNIGTYIAFYESIVRNFDEYKVFTKYIDKIRKDINFGTR